METALRRREQEVWQVLDDLWAMHGDAKNLTGEAIRERLVVLGKSRGSPNEIYKYRKTWVKSRGVGLGSAPEAQEGYTDPISRAVHMVHEKLQEETLQQINELRLKHEQEMVLKDEEISFVKQSLGKVVAEFGDLDRELKRVVAENKELTQQLAAEIEIRKAAERELAVMKIRAEHVHTAHEAMLKEIKSAHDRHVASLQEEKHAMAHKYEQDIFALKDDKKQMGHEFSEQVTMLKLDIHNKEIVYANLSNKMAEIISDKNKLHDAIETLTQENQALGGAFAQKCLEQTLMQQALDDKVSELKRINWMLKKAEITVARLRVAREASHAA